VRHSELLPQLTQKLGHFDARLFSLGLTAFAIGLFKKVCIADNLAPFATPVFAAADARTPSSSTSISPGTPTWP
jgi:D-alanyl-lipoteichoic acid acyltransferase DltB (MBOAT superfamily)